MRWIMTFCSLLLLVAVADAHLLGRLRARRDVEVTTTTTKSTTVTKMVQMPVRPSTDKAPGTPPTEKIGPPKTETKAAPQGSCADGNCSGPARGFFFRRR